MTTNAEAIGTLEAAKSDLQAQAKTATGATLERLDTAIQTIADEVGRLETSALDAAGYVPQTGAFKAVTEEAKAFVATLNNLKAAFAAVAGLAGVIDRVMKLIK